MKYIVKTPYPCLVKTQNEFCELDPTDSLEVDDEPFLLIYPQTERIPFCINLDALQENQNFSVLKHEGSTMIFLEPVSNVEVFKKETLHFSGATCNVCVSKKQVTFETDTKKIVLDHKNTVGAKILKIKNFAVVAFEKEVFALSMKNNKISHFTGDEIKLDGETLWLSKSSSSRKKTATYKFDDDIIVQAEIFDDAQKDYSTELIPFRLLESVQAQDFAFVYEHLSSALQEKLDQSQIKKFFGSFNNFLPLSTTEFITVSAQEKNYVKFDLCDDKILDITIDKL